MGGSRSVPGEMRGKDLPISWVLWLELRLGGTCRPCLRPSAVCCGHLLLVSLAEPIPTASPLINAPQGTGFPSEERAAQSCSARCVWSRVRLLAPVWPCRPPPPHLTRLSRRGPFFHSCDSPMTFSPSSTHQRWVVSPHVSPVASAV